MEPNMQNGKNDTFTIDTNGISDSGYVASVQKEIVSNANI